MEDLKESLEIAPESKKEEEEQELKIDKEEINEERALEIHKEEIKKEQSIEKNIIENNTNNIKENISDAIKENSPEVSENTPSESVDIKNEDANTTNCLALTIQEEHKLTAIKNVFFRTIRMSWKVAVSTITLALIKLFS